ncbi:hypothetical protein P879_08285 [Paragonimus westermani]|uniref:Histidine ammonia-lyase n=1 Tax=Paragonimus westermani TaxID=34504 RepID=A0A8T0D9S9_9TREM|nr:hypothetical protein P879_08285 [Paragonimus westermani]
MCCAYKPEFRNDVCPSSVYFSLTRFFRELSTGKMHINVKVLSDYLVVTVDENRTIQWLTDEAITKYKKGFSGLAGDPYKDTEQVGNYGKKEENLSIGRVTAVRRRRDYAMLCSTDIVGEVLRNEEYVIIEFETHKTPFWTSQGIHNADVDSGFNLHLDETAYLELDGESLTPEDLVALGKGQYRIKLSNRATKRVSEARKVIENIVSTNKVTYGVNTGFGMFASTVIDNLKLKDLQLSLIRSHAAGVGNPLSLQATKMLFALRINVLAKGYSGISLETLQRMINIYNATCLPWVPERGTVGASGDLAPLSHLALGLIGEGRMWSPTTGWTTAKNALTVNGLDALDLKPKEGLCLINGTQLITSIGAHACVKAELLARQADVIAALSVEVCRGTSVAFDPDVGRVRPHKGQIDVAHRLTMLLNNELYPSELAESHRYCNKVQDAYTLRCCPQVHGIVWDTIDFARKVLTTEMNSATDNPLVFSERGEVISAGNFHGEYPAKVLDYLGIAVNELANISERRIDRLINPGE